ncbi:MAG TPA: helix-turn-helix domain-containing protein, partial [Candidatus Limnocylindrales bacterium]
MEVEFRVAPVFDRTTNGDLVTIAEAARLAGVHRNTVRSWCASGRLSSVRINRRGDRRIRRGDIQGLVARRSAPSAPHLLPPVALTQAPVRPETAGLAARDAAIRRIAGEVSRGANLETILADVIDASVALFTADRAALWLYEPDLAQPFRLAAQRNLSPALREATNRLTMADDEALVRCVRDRR